MTSWLVIPHRAIKKRFWRDPVKRHHSLKFRQCARASRSRCPRHRKLELQHPLLHDGKTKVLSWTVFLAMSESVGLMSCLV